jgi:hypothetical protein
LHYHQQQKRIPTKPRFPQEQWIGYKALQPQTDEEIIADIITTDTAAIAAGRVVRIVRGTQDPAVLRLLEV